MRILIIRPAALGDTLMLVPALDRVGHSASVSVAGRNPGLGYLRPFVRLCLDFEAAGWHSLFTRTPEVASLPEAELVVAFLRDPEGALKRNLSALLPGAEVHLFHGLPAATDGVHVACHLARCLRKAGVGVDPDEAMMEALSRPLLRGNGLSRPDGGILLHPGSGGREKNHPPEFWMEVVSRMRREPPFLGRGCTVLLGPAEADLRSFFERNLGNQDAKMVFAPGREELVSLLTAAGLYVGHDSGITHLAAMLGTPTLALFRNSSAELWRPLGPKVSLLRHPVPDLHLVLQVLAEARSLMRVRDEGP
jgi:hypothetical protein